MAIRGVADAIATYLCSDIADVREGRYHYGRTGTLQIYVIGNDYMTAVKTGKKVPRPHDEDYHYNWKLLQADFQGWDIYECDPTAEEK